MLTTLSLLVAVACPQAGQGTPAPAPGARYLRLVEADEGDVLRLETSVRTFVPARGDGPEISLAAAVHIGERSFYEDLQEFLDTRDIVLFERVKPAGTGFARHDRDEPDGVSRVRISRARLRFLAVALEEYHDRHGRYPVDMGGLVDGLPLDRVLLIDVASVDAWDTPVKMVVASPTRRGKYELISLGADGAEGGAGQAADLFFSDMLPLTPAERGVELGIQKDLADAMGLVFQLEAMDHSGTSWINCDLAMDQIEERLGSVPGDGDLFGMLSGESMVSRVAGKALRFVGATGAGSSTLKLLGIELLARADELLEAAPRELGGLMEVVIGARNEVVIEELAEIIRMSRDAGGGGPETVGVIYGAGHMRDLERRLRDELGYRPERERWVRAVELDLDDLGIGRRQVGWLRRGIAGALDSQLGDG